MKVKKKIIKGWIENTLDSDTIIKNRLYLYGMVNISILKTKKQAGKSARKVELIIYGGNKWNLKKLKRKALNNYN